MGAALSVSGCKTRRQRGGGPPRKAREITEQKQKVEALEEKIQRLEQKAKLSANNSELLTMLRDELVGEKDILEQLKGERPRHGGALSGGRQRRATRRRR